MRKLGSLVVTLTCGLALVVACSSADSRPAPSVDGEGEGGTTSGQISDGGGEGGEGGDANANLPASCRDTMADNTETDVDCGGGTCAPCALGKKCKAPTDCSAVGATCDNGICALCHNGKTDGSETDTDCGGTACGTCLIGKLCLVGSDCSSGTCGPDKACACPPAMIHVSTADSGAYCIDAQEATKGQYNSFISAAVPVSTQTGSCLTDNVTFAPRAAWPPATVPFDAQTNPNPLAYSMSLPVHYVDWCDATAYCKWAKKSLCGSPTGTSIALTDRNDATKSVWYNACSVQGTKPYPYGSSTYQSGVCNGNGMGFSGQDLMNNINDGAAYFGFSSNADQGVYWSGVSDATGAFLGPAHNNCFGGSTGLYQMSGNVAEWENSCDGTAATSNCAVRGGSYAANDDPVALACAAQRTVVRVPTTDVAGAALLADVGIRCCLY